MTQRDRPMTVKVSPNWVTRQVGIYTTFELRATQLAFERVIFNSYNKGQL